MERKPTPNETRAFWTPAKKTKGLRVTEELTARRKWPRGLHLSSTPCSVRFCHISSVLFGFSWLSEWIFPWGILYPSVHTHCSLVQELGSLGPALVLMVPSDVPLMPCILALPSRPLSTVTRFYSDGCLLFHSFSWAHMVWFGLIPRFPLSHCLGWDATKAKTQ